MTESKDQRKGWLRDLKVGDKVFVLIEVLWGVAKNLLLLTR